MDETEIYKKVGLFGQWNPTNFNMEVTFHHAPGYEPGVKLERPFSSKTITMTVEEARQLANTILSLLPS